MIPSQTSLFLQDRYSWWVDLLLLTLIIGSLFFIWLGTRPLFVPDEGRYAEIAREMAASGNYLTPYLNGIKYFEKPVLFYWLGAFAIKIGGLHIGSLRSINALLGLLGGLFTYVTARKLYGRLAGFLSALLLSTSLLYFVMAHMISLDLPVTVFLAISLYTFLLGTETSSPTTRRRYLWAAFSSAALATLTKGLIGMVFPVMIISAWLTVTTQWPLIKRLFLPSSLLFFFLIAAPWHILVGWHNPEFFYFYFIEQHFLRYTLMGVGHYQPIWFFIPTLILGFFPWIVFLPQAIVALFSSRKKDRDYQTALFFFLWAFLIFLFFSFSKSKLIPYILPVFPPLSILTGRYLAIILHQSSTKGLRVGYLFLILLAAFIVCTFYFYLQHALLLDPKRADIELKLVTSLLVMGTAISAFLAYSRKAYQAIAVTLSMSWLLSLALLIAMPSLDIRTIQPLALTLKSLLQPQDEVITFNQYYQDLPFYLERRVSILNWRNELAYGMQYQATQSWMIDDATFWQRWHSPQRVFVFMSRPTYLDLQEQHPEEKIHLLGQTVNDVLISNQDPHQDT